MKTRSTSFFLSIALLSGACKVGPDYRRPEVAVPEQHQAAQPAPEAAPQPLAELTWKEVFTDPVLQELIRVALEQNSDLRIAASRILEARANLGIVRSRYGPEVGVGADYTTAHVSRNGGAPLPAGADANTQNYDVFLGVSAWELDFWGKVGRAEEGARATLLGTEEARNVVAQSIVADVAAAYYQLLGLDRELEIAKSTLAARLESLDLAQKRESGGVGSLADVRQAEVLVSAARAALPTIQLAISQIESQLNLLLGNNPGPLARGRPLLEIATPAAIEAGLPSELLERRPDLRAAEQGLVAANADVGLARAAYYPSISLTGSLGAQSSSLSGLFSGGSHGWSFTPSVQMPLFNGGRIDAQNQAAAARYDQALENYKQAVRQAFADVSTGLVAFQRTRELLGEFEQGVEAQRDAVRLARVRYEGGVAGYFEVLVNDQHLFEAELQLARTHAEHLVRYVRLYRALGGGWRAGTGAGAAR